MTMPEMIIFDYGHTLIYEAEFDTLRGTEAVLKYASRNKNNLSAEEVNTFSGRLFDRTTGTARGSGCEIHNQLFQKLLYEYLGIDIPLAPAEIERIFWNNASPGSLMPGAAEMLDYIGRKGIRSGVISNISFSGEALAERIKRFLPDNRFEFIIASSEYILRKPDPVLFGLALRKAELPPEKVWFCGDSAAADVMGAASAGIFPVWYQNGLKCIYHSKSDEKDPGCGHLHIREWTELTEILEKG